MTNGKGPDAYDVGYGKPPKSTRWRKGISGNPKGRPKKSKSFYDLSKKELDKKHRITEGGQTKWLSTKEIIARRVWLSAMQEKSIKGFRVALDLIREIEDKFGEPIDGIPKHGVLVVTGTLSEEEWEKQNNDRSTDA